MSGSKPKRRLRNFLLEPGLQGRLSLYCAIASAVFAAAIYGILLTNYGSITEAIMQLTGSNEQIREIIGLHWNGTQVWIYLAAGVYVVAITLISVWYTHRMVGPTFAFRRHLERLEEGDFAYRTHLRRGDAFGEVAEALNRLSSRMEKNREH